MIPASKNNVEEIKTSNTSESLCSSIIYPLQYATIMAKYDIGTSNNYWKTEDTSLIKNVKNTKDGTSVQLKNNEKMSATRTGNTPLQISLRAHAKRRTFLMDYKVPPLSP